MKSTLTTRKGTVSKKSSPLTLRLGILLLLFIGVLAIFLLPRVGRAVLTQALSKTTGLEVQVSEFDVHWLRAGFSGKEIRFLNPAGFPSGELARIGKLDVRLGSLPFGGGQAGFKKVRINFKEFRLLRNKTGKLNLPRPLPSSEPSNIAELILNLGPVTYTDVSGAQAVQKDFDLGLVNAVYRNVKGVSGILEILRWETLKRTGLEEETHPFLPQIKPILESQMAGQTASRPAQTNPAESNPLQSAPSSAPSAQKAG